MPLVLLAIAALVLTPGCASLGVQKGGFNLVSLDEEWAMRDDLRRQVERQHTVVRDPAADAYIQQLGERLARQTELADRRWDFGIVEDDSLNAFNLPGGLVYVHTGLIREAATLDQLAGVMAHEVGHGAARHGTQLMTRAYGLTIVTALVLGDDPGMTERVLAEMVGSGVLQSYSRGAEEEADRLGVRYAYDAGIDPQGIPDFFRALLRERQRRPSALEQFFSSHPVTEDRIEDTEALIATLPPRSLSSDTPEYQRFRARFR